VGFLNSEFGLLGLKTVEDITAKVTDTLKMAKEMRPGQRNNLDALCRHFGIDNSKRTLHGALLDAELLADVYMAMTRGQESLMMALDKPEQTGADVVPKINAPILVKQASADEQAAHEDYLAGLAKSGNCIWNS